MSGKPEDTRSPSANRYDISLLPRRRRWESTPGETGRATIGLLIGFLIAGVMAAMTLGDHWTSAGMILICMTIVMLGTFLALFPMIPVIMAERLFRIDLGAIAWVAIGAVPSIVLGYGLIRHDKPTLAVAFCTGPLAALFAHVLRGGKGRRMDDRQMVRIAVAAALIVAAAIALAHVLPELKSLRMMD